MLKFAACLASDRLYLFTWFAVGNPMIYSNKASDITDLWVLNGLPSFLIYASSSSVILET